MKIIYTNISPVTKAYTNFNHIYYIKKQNPKKVYLCVWDSFVFEHPLFENEQSKNKSQKLQENVEAVEKLMISLNIDYKIIYLSDAMDRLLKHSEYSAILQKILSKFKIENLKKGFDIEYIPFNQISLSKINYIISDYLIAINLPELFPELCPTTPNYYLTSERFKIFQKEIDSAITHFNGEHPKIIFVKKVPVIISDKEEIPSIEMQKDKINNIVENYYSDKQITEKEVIDLIEVFSPVVKNLKFSKIKRQFIEQVGENLNNYFAKIQKIIQKENAKKRTKSLFISTLKEFEKQIKPLNNFKIKIMNMCDGSNSSLDISKKTGIKLSTVSTYFNYLKKQNLITGNRKPKRTVDNIVINLREMI